MMLRSSLKRLSAASITGSAFDMRGTNGRSFFFAFAPGALDAGLTIVAFGVICAASAAEDAFDTATAVGEAFAAATAGAFAVATAGAFAVAAAVAVAVTAAAAVAAAGGAFAADDGAFPAAGGAEGDRGGAAADAAPTPAAISGARSLDGVLCLLEEPAFRFAPTPATLPEAAFNGDSIGLAALGLELSAIVEESGPSLTAPSCCLGTLRTRRVRG